MTNFEKALAIADRFTETNPSLRLSMRNMLAIRHSEGMRDYLDGFTHALYMANVISQEERDIIRMTKYEEVEE